MEHTYMTYDEAAERLRIKPDSVRRRARAKNWPRRQGNDGKAQVGIPPGLLGEDRPGGSPPGSPPDHTLAIRLAVAEAQLANVTEDRDRLALLLEKSLERRPSIIDRIFGR